MRRAMLFALLTIAACTGGGASVFVDNAQCESIVQRFEAEPLAETRVRLSGGGFTTLVSVEVADTEGPRSRGLMCRSEIPEGTGMLFDLGGRTTGPFWMFNTYVPLDIIYFKVDGSVSGTAAMLPCTREGGEPESQWHSRCLDESKDYAPEQSYTHALELPAGWLSSQGYNLLALPDDIRITIL
ncbi:MAG: DUF192 domain-containing protein [Chloroflexi bacterium]|nr:DUF192 domain-containing protein [Chloroflexota bacterium]